MHKQIGLNGPSETLETDTSITVDRRVLIGAFGLGAIAMAGGVVKHMTAASGNHISSSTDNEVIDQSVSPEMSKNNIKNLLQDPELFADGIDPHVLVGLSYEELMDIGGVPITEVNKHDVQTFAKDFLAKYTLFLRGGNTQEDLINEIEQGVQIGVRDDKGLLLTSKVGGVAGHGEFVNQHIGIPMLQGMGPDSFNGIDIMPVKDVLLQQQFYDADLFEFSATQNVGSSAGDPTLNTVEYVTFQNAEELDVADGAFSDVANASRVRINFTTQRTAAGDIMDNSVTMTYVPDIDEMNYRILFENFNKQ